MLFENGHVYTGEFINDSIADDSVSAAAYAMVSAETLGVADSSQEIATNVGDVRACFVFIIICVCLRFNFYLFISLYLPQG